MEGKIEKAMQWYEDLDEREAFRFHTKYGWQLGYGKDDLKIHSIKVYVKSYLENYHNLGTRYAPFNRHIPNAVAFDIGVKVGFAIYESIIAAAIIFGLKNKKLNGRLNTFKNRQHLRGKAKLYKKRAQRVIDNYKVYTRENSAWFVFAVNYIVYKYVRRFLQDMEREIHRQYKGMAGYVGFHGKMINSVKRGGLYTSNEVNSKGGRWRDYSPDEEERTDKRVRRVKGRDLKKYLKPQSR
jgi:hypothetical protein